VELEVLLEPGEVHRAGPLDVDPAEALVLDYLYARLSARGRGRRIDPRAR